MKNTIGAVTLFFAGFFVMPTSADVVAVTTIDTHGNTAAYLEALEPLMARLEELNPDAEMEVFRATLAGPAVDLIYFIPRVESVAAYGEVTENSEGDAEYQRLLQRLAATGRTLESRSLLTEVSF